MARILKKEVADRCQKAVTGFQIPLTSVNALYVLLERAVRAGKTDDELREIVQEFVGG